MNSLAVLGEHVDKHLGSSVSDEKPIGDDGVLFTFWRVNRAFLGLLSVFLFRIWETLLFPARISNFLSASVFHASSSLVDSALPSHGIDLSGLAIPSGPLIRRRKKKTLVIDLDETLVHSSSVGNAMFEGHMVEVKPSNQHAILYYVSKRPYCDLFLLQVSRWYDLILFTASVQEYADPVVEWLERDRSYFKCRYYRQHCQVVDSVYTKNVGSVVNDLKHALIVDNSPWSYILNPDNAVPISGWVGDTSDKELVELIPFLYALSFVPDVRSIVGLRTM